MYGLSTRKSGTWTRLKVRNERDSLLLAAALPLGRDGTFLVARMAVCRASSSLLLCSVMVLVLAATAAGISESKFSRATWSHQQCYFGYLYLND